MQINSFKRDEWKHSNETAAYELFDMQIWEYFLENGEKKHVEN